MSKVKAIRVGDKIIVFIEGKRQTISKSVSPEIFDVVLNYIRNNQTDKISEVFNSFDDKICEYLKDFFKVKNGLLYNEEDNKKLVYSKLIIRKAVEMMSLKISPLPLKRLSEKIEYKENISENGIEAFKKVEKLTITEEGNLIFYTNFLTDKGKKEMANTLYGSPIDINGNNQNGYSLTISRENDTKVLVSPFDIISFTDHSINVSRFKVLDNKKIDDCIVVIKNEKLFDMSFDIFKENKEKFD